MRSIAGRWCRVPRRPVPAVAAAVLVAVLGPALLAPSAVTTVTAAAAVHPHHADDAQDEGPVRCEPPHDGLLQSGEGRVGKERVPMDRYRWSRGNQITTV